MNFPGETRHWEHLQIDELPISLLAFSLGLIWLSSGEIERKHLARELHDELGQYLNAIKLDAVSIGDRQNADPKYAIDASQAIIRAVGVSDSPVSSSRFACR